MRLFRAAVVAKRKFAWGGTTVCSNRTNPALPSSIKVFSILLRAVRPPPRKVLALCNPNLLYLPYSAKFVRERPMPLHPALVIIVLHLLIVGACAVTASSTGITANNRVTTVAYGHQDVGAGAGAGAGELELGHFPAISLLFTGVTRTACLISGALMPHPDPLGRGKEALATGP
jgi:hypothetical protein